METITLTHHVEIGDYEFPVEIAIDYQPEEKMTLDYPGCPEGVAYSVSMFGQELDFNHPIVQGIQYETVIEMYHDYIQHLRF